ncbi:MAG: hypothetical protein NT015_09710 [Alphaproteobacteria bacterium]|nr:hypothetical protein [Alphaproteobacteria bacterium]
MRIRYFLASAAVLAFAAPAWAQSTPVSFSPEFQSSLEETYGVREGEVLRAAVTDAISRELTRRGVSAESASIDVTIVDAEPNRPTMQQLLDRPSLDFSSISIGGAELRATVRGANGATTEVTHRGYNHSLSDVVGPATTWTEARRAIRQFAVKVADAYVATPR